MAKKSKLLNDAAEKIGTAMGKANRTAHKVAKAGVLAKKELEDISKQVEALKKQLKRQRSACEKLWLRLSDFALARARAVQLALRAFFCFSPVLGTARNNAFLAGSAERLFFSADIKSGTCSRLARGITVNFLPWAFASISFSSSC